MPANCQIQFTLGTLLGEYFEYRPYELQVFKRNSSDLLFCFNTFLTMFDLRREIILLFYY